MYCIIHKSQTKSSTAIISIIELDVITIYNSAEESGIINLCKLMYVYYLQDREFGRIYSNGEFSMKLKCHASVVDSHNKVL